MTKKCDNGRITDERKMTMYIDDVTAVQIGGLYEVREELRELQKEEENLRRQLNKAFDEANTDLFSTDEFTALRQVRTTIIVDKKELQANHSDLFNEVAVVGNSNVITINKRRTCLAVGSLNPERLEWLLFFPQSGGQTKLRL